MPLRERPARGPRPLFRNPGVQAPAIPAIKGGARITEHRLRNGLKVLVAERHADPIVAVMLFYRVGSRNETEREAGVSHFLEHMMFKGTRRFGKGEVDRLTTCLLYTSPSPRDQRGSRMPSSA